MGLPPDITREEILEFAVLAIPGLIAAVAGGYAGWLNARHVYVRTGWFLVFLPTASYVAGWLIFFFLPAHGIVPPDIGSFVLWHMVTVPLISICVNFGWASSWLARLFCKGVRNNRTGSR
jgi:hypothetical protein